MDIFAEALAEEEANYVETSFINPPQAAGTSNSSFINPLPPETSNASFINPLPPETLNTSIVNPLPPDTLNASSINPLHPKVQNTSSINPLPAQAQNVKSTDTQAQLLVPEEVQTPGSLPRDSEDHSEKLCDTEIPKVKVVEESTQGKSVASTENLDSLGIVIDKNVVYAQFVKADSSEEQGYVTGSDAINTNIDDPSEEQDDVTGSDAINTNIDDSLEELDDVTGSDAITTNIDDSLPDKKDNESDLQSQAFVAKTDDDNSGESSLEKKVAESANELKGIASSHQLQETRVSECESEDSTTESQRDEQEVEN